MAIEKSTRVLVVADWTVEATDVVAECRRIDRPGRALTGEARPQTPSLTRGEPLAASKPRAIYSLTPADRSCRANSIG